MREVGAALAAALWLSAPAVAGTEARLWFTDQAEAALVAVRNLCGGPTKRHILEAHGSGAAFFDYDRDGHLDLYVVNGSTAQALGRGPGNSLLHNLGHGAFADASAGSGLDDRGWGAGVAVGDLDGDGWDDVYLTNYGPNRLFQNAGDGTFTDITAASGTAGNEFSASAAWFDADQDGDLDLYVTSYVGFDLDAVPADPALDEPCMYLGGIRVFCGPVGLPQAPDRLYRNDGDGRFADVTAASGVAEADAGYGLGVVPEDFDGDGRVDLFVANDETANAMLRNDGGLRFTDVAAEAGVAVGGDGQTQACMGVDAGDVDDDGDADLHVTNFYGETNTLYRNDGAWRFVDATVEAGLAAPTVSRLGWGTHFVDLDLDGDQDLFVANGHVYPQVDASETGERYAQANQLFRNDGRGVFADVSPAAGPGLAVVRVSRGTCVGDYDGDGDSDLFVVNLDEAPTLLRNDTSGAGHWLAVRLAGGPGTAAGARVEVASGGRIQVRAANRCAGYLGANEPVLRFGLGAATAARLVVRWPGGRSQEVGEVAADRVVDVAP